METREVVKSLREGYHAVFIGSRASLEVYRSRDRSGECFIGVMESDDGDIVEAKMRSGGELVKVMKAWGSLDSWKIYNPYPEQPSTVPDEDEYELMEMGNGEV